MPEQGTVVIGDALIDEMRSETHTSEAVGGAALNVATGLARLGHPATLLAMIGEDEPGQEIRRYLDHYGVRCVSSPSRFGTSRAVSIRHRGEPTYEFNQAAQHREIAFTDARAEAVQDADAIVVSCFPFDNAQQSSDLLQLATANEKRLYIVDPNARPTMIASRDRFAQEFLRHVPHVDVVKLSDEDAEYLFGTDAATGANLLVDQGANAVIATYGANGAEVVTSTFRVATPIADLPGPIIDSMGGGDATLATVVARIWRDGLPDSADAWEHILQEAMLNAGATCRVAGALLHTPLELTRSDESHESNAR